MMQINELLQQMGGLHAVAQELGVSDAQAQDAAAALIPAILGGFKQQAKAQPTGLEGLAGMLGSLGGGSLLDNVLAPEPTDVSRGNDVLGQIFGSKDVSRAVAQNAAGQSGLDPNLLKKMLPMLAMLVAGFMSRQGGVAAMSPAGMQAGAGQGNPLGDMLGGILGGMMGGKAAGPAAGAGSLGGLASMLDLDGDGNPLNDILGMAGKMMR